MRSFDDDRGATWDVALERGSYGAYFLIFAQRSGGDLRRTTLAASTFAEAQQEFAGLTLAGLRARLAAADPWDSGAS